ncbi:MAG: heavy metal-associated domain-containing protein [Ethanoligenens sp.]|uniref:heavy-metal-associated domain-containing protein n=1 Tax=Ethanoligenens sp. TaxID=2099655 RepID=UPI0039EC734C
MEKIVLYISGMMCMKCKGKVEQALKDLGGISAYEVDLENGKASVEYDASAVTPDTMKAVITDKGFTVTAIS